MLIYLLTGRTGFNRWTLHGRAVAVLSTATNVAVIPRMAAAGNHYHQRGRGNPVPQGSPLGGTVEPAPVPPGNPPIPASPTQMSRGRQSGWWSPDEEGGGTGRVAARRARLQTFTHEQLPLPPTSPARSSSLDPTRPGGWRLTGGRLVARTYQES